MPLLLKESGALMIKFTSNRTWFAINSSLILIVSLFAPTLASAYTPYSGFGDGTQANPYTISTCDQLQEIKTFPSSYFVLVSNIDCSANTSFTPIGQGSANIFVGTLDGQHHVIKNLTIDEPSSNEVGLFSSIAGATVKDLELRNSNITGLSFVGAIAGYVWSGSTITGIHADFNTITVNGGPGGGIVGYFQDSTLAQSAVYGGSIYAPTSGAVGGLVGYLYDSTITDSRFDASITANNSSGGIIGYAISGSNISNVYSRGAFTITNGGSYVGGLGGYADSGSINNSFSDMTITGATSYVVETIGGPTVALSSVFGGIEAAGSLDCASYVTPNCTLVPGASFKGNSSYSVFDTWDFQNIWETSPDHQPTLRSYSLLDYPKGVPNSGDANGDGINDTYQANVANVEDDNGVWVNLSVPNSTGCNFNTSSSINHNTLPIDSGFTALTNMNNYTLNCLYTGQSVPITMIFNKVYANPILRVYDPVTGTYSTPTGLAFSTVTINGVEKTRADYFINNNLAIGTPASQATFTSQVAGLSTVSIQAPITGFGKISSSNASTSIAINLLGLSLVIASIVYRRYLLLSA